MPVYHFVLHAYGTWHPDHPGGWHQHGERGPMRPDVALGRYRKKTQRWETAGFAAYMRTPLVEMVLDICRRRGWRCHAAAVNETHVHIVASWREEMEALRAQHAFKRLLGWRAAKLAGTEGRRWFSDGGIPKRVRDKEHLSYLVNIYLPGQGGAIWVEGWPCVVM